MKYITVKRLRTMLDISEQIGIVMVEKNKDWLRLISSEKMKNGIVKYMFDSGGGDTALIYFKEDKAFIKGFDHENEYNQIANYDEVESPKFFKQIYKDVPCEFFELLDEEEIEETTFVLWNIDGSDEWQHNKMEDDGGFEYLFDSYCDLTKLHDSLEYYTETTNEMDINFLYELSKGYKIKKEDILRLNPNRDVTEALEELSTL